MKPSKITGVSNQSNSITIEMDVFHYSTRLQLREILKQFPSIKVGENVTFEETVTLCDNVTIEDNVSIGKGSFISQYTHIGKECNIGRNTEIGINVKIKSNTNIGSNVNIGSMSTIGSKSSVGNECLLGTNVKLVEDVLIFANAKIGNNTTIGEGTIVREGANIGRGIVIGKGCNIGRSSILKKGYRRLKITYKSLKIADNVNIPPFTKIESVREVNKESEPVRDTLVIIPLNANGELRNMQGYIQKNGEIRISIGHHSKLLKEWLDNEGLVQDKAKFGLLVTYLNGVKQTMNI